jgi:hypothetical protein
MKPHLAAMLLLAGCAAQPRPAPVVSAPEAAPPIPEALPPTISPPAAPLGWEDQPLTPGDWRYMAGPPAAAEYGQSGGVQFVVRCDPGQRRVLLSRTDAAGALTIRTTFSTRTVEGPLPATDPFLDAIAFSRGRFAVEAPGQAALILPTWPEPARVVEECRP